MKDFMLIFRRDPDTKENQPSPQEMQASIKHWQDWAGGIAAQNKLVSADNRLQPEGRVVKKDDLVINGPYAEIKEVLGGFFLVKARDFEEAVAMAKGCPILQSPWNGNVEVRMLVGQGSND